MTSKSLYQIMTDLGVAQLPAWTISTTNKLPIDPKPALKANFDVSTASQWFAIAKDPKNTLVTLDELYACPNAPNRCALYADIEKQKIMLVDVETIYDKKFNTLMKKLPIVYGENSKNGGKHFVVPIPDDILNDINFQPLFLKSKIVFAETNEPHSGIELFFRNHYITFTQDQLNVSNKNTSVELRAFLDEILKIANTTLVDNQMHINIEDDIPTDALTLSKYVLSERQKNIIRKFIRKNDTANESDREYKNIYAITRQIMGTINNNFRMKPLPVNALIDPNAANDPTILTWLVLHFVYQFLEPREKWDRMITATQNYISYSCNKAVNYCIQNP